MSNPSVRSSSIIMCFISPGAAQEVLRPPTFIQKMQNSRAQEGDTVRMECKVEASPPPQLFWKKDKDMLRVDPNRMRCASRPDCGPEFMWFRWWLEQVGGSGGRRSMDADIGDQSPKPLHYPDNRMIESDNKSNNNSIIIPGMYSGFSRHPKQLICVCVCMCVCVGWGGYDTSSITSVCSTHLGDAIHA